MRRGVALVVGWLAAIGCTAPPPETKASAASPDARGGREPSERPRESAPARAVVDGKSFPDGVVALTWDDGPDARTLELATFLAREHVSATFFVVAEWTPGTSAEPGEGTDVLLTGHRALPVLRDLVGLGHRIGNHTEHHALLHDATEARVQEELAANQRAIDPLLTNELRLFRAPGGAWSASASNAVDAHPTLRDLVGPIGWDVDRKDWEGSLYCRSDAPDAECEPLPLAGKRRRVRAAVTAQRYVASIESARRGIALLHDRVGHVGSSYALEVAKILVRELSEKGFVFAPPVLRFSRLSVRLDDPGDPGAALQIVDVDGDGYGDLCEERRCALAERVHGDDGLARVRFRPWRARAAPPTPSAAPLRPSVAASLPGVDPAAVRYGDLNGDGRPDACGLGPTGAVLCALATKNGFASATTWLDDAAPAAARQSSALALGDVTGDGRADVCVRGERAIRCAAAP